jgi:DNA-binding response OmpR family regulator
MPNNKILIIDDDPDILEIIRFVLAREGYEVLVSGNGAQGYQSIMQELPALVLFDLILPDMGGLDICRELRANVNTQYIQVIIVTARAEESDIVLGLGMGADDYIAKPFNPNELLARVKAAMRRVEQKASFDSHAHIHVGPLVIDGEEVSVRAGANLVKLTLAEFRILQALASRPGRVFTRESLVKYYAGNHAVVEDRNVDVHVRCIRKALGEHRGMIETVRGVGYRLAVNES